MGLGLVAAWAADNRLVTENVARAMVYTIGLFGALVMALRPAWRRLRLWTDLAIWFFLHAVLVVLPVKLLDSHSLRLNWAVALPLVAPEFLLFLSLLWRRNVSDSSG